MGDLAKVIKEQFDIVNKRFDEVNQKFSDQSQQISEQSQKLSDHIENPFNDADLDKLVEKLSPNLDSKFKAVKESIESTIDEKIAKLDFSTQISQIKAEFDEKLSQLTAKLSAAEQTINDLNAQVGHMGRGKIIAANRAIENQEASLFLSNIFPFLDEIITWRTQDEDDETFHALKIIAESAENLKTALTNSTPNSNEIKVRLADFLRAANGHNQIRKKYDPHYGYPMLFQRDIVYVGLVGKKPSMHSLILRSTHSGAAQFIRAILLAYNFQIKNQSNRLRISPARLMKYYDAANRQMALARKAGYCEKRAGLVAGYDVKFHIFDTEPTPKILLKSTTDSSFEEFLGSAENQLTLTDGILSQFGSVVCQEACEDFRRLMSEPSAPTHPKQHTPPQLRPRQKK